MKGVAISKGQGPNTYILTTSDNKSIKYQDFTGKSDELITGKHDIQLRLVEPVAGQANVVEVNGKLYFQFKKGAPLYSSITEVVSGGKVVGQLQYQDYKAKEPIKKAKKAKTKGSAKRVLDSIKETKENIQKLLNKSFDVSLFTSSIVRYFTFLSPSKKIYVVPGFIASYAFASTIDFPLTYPVSLIYPTFILSFDIGAIDIMMK